MVHLDSLLQLCDCSFYMICKGSVPATQAYPHDQSGGADRAQALPARDQGGTGGSLAQITAMMKVYSDEGQRQRVAAPLSKLDNPGCILGKFLGHWDLILVALDEAENQPSDKTTTASRSFGEVVAPCLYLLKILFV